MRFGSVQQAHVLAAAACLGLVAATATRGSPAAATVVLAVATGAALILRRPRTVAAVAVLSVAWWWGSARLDALDRSVLVPLLGTSEEAVVVTTGPARAGRFDLRISARVERFGRTHPDETVLLELPLGRSPPQGSRLEVLGQLVPPRGPSHGFDERMWLRRHGVHVVLQGDRWHWIGRRGGLAGVGDRFHAWLARSMARGLHGERRAVVLGVVLGEQHGLSQRLQQDFQAAGLYHMLAVSGENVALAAGGALALAWLLGLPRLLGHLAALAAIAAYVLAVGAQPSVLRAGVTGGLASLAWIAARQRDRWQFLLLAAVALLAWNPYLLFDAGFDLSFAAVASIFVTVRPLLRVLEGYPVPDYVAGVIAVSTACGIGTAPIAWLQFHRIPLLTVPANVLAQPIMVPLLALGFAAAAVAPLAPALAAVLAGLNGCCAAYLAGCARVFGRLPGAQATSGWGAAAALGCVLLAAAYAWRRGQRARAGLPAHRQRPPEDRARAPAPARPFR